jgi:hypothetical protein
MGRRDAFGFCEWECNASCFKRKRRKWDACASGTGDQDDRVEKVGAENESIDLCGQVRAMSISVVYHPAWAGKERGQARNFNHLSLQKRNNNARPVPFYLGKNTTILFLAARLVV